MAAIASQKEKFLWNLLAIYVAFVIVRRIIYIAKRWLALYVPYLY
jgi:hypothetical protein